MELALLGAVLLFYLVKEGNKFKDNLNLYNVKIHKMKFDNKKSLESGYLSAFFDLTLSINNKSDVGATITNIDIKLISNGVLLGVVKGKTNIKINPKGKSLVNIPVKIPIVGAITQASDIIKNLIANKPIEMKVEGVISLFDIPVKINEEIKL